MQSALEPVRDERRLIALSVAASIVLHATVLALSPHLRHAHELEPPRVLSVVLVQPRAEEDKPAAVPPVPRPPQAKSPPRGAPPPAQETRVRAPPAAQAPVPASAAPPADDASPKEERLAASAPAAVASAPSVPVPAVPSAFAAAPREPSSPPDFRAAYLRNPPPAYPAAARRNGEEGTVTLRVLVSTEGSPRQVTLERSSGSSVLDAAALATVKTWRFSPARRGGEAQEAWVLVPVVFRLEPRG